MYKIYAMYKVNTIYGMFFKLLNHFFVFLSQNGSSNIIYDEIREVLERRRAAQPSVFLGQVGKKKWKKIATKVKKWVWLWVELKKNSGKKNSGKKKVKIVTKLGLAKSFNAWLIKLVPR
jgi:hypothetical protein